MLKRFLIAILFAGLFLSLIMLGFYFGVFHMPEAGGAVIASIT
jgi:hypothetical protein